jgi:hypothetical protein
MGPTGTWETLPPLPERPGHGRNRVTASAGLMVAALRAMRAKGERTGSTAERRKRSDAGRVGGSRSACVVPGNPGNRPKRPGGGKAGIG